MRWFKFKRMTGRLALTAMVLAPTSLLAQSPASFTLTVEDSRGVVLPGATVHDSAGKLLDILIRTES